MLRAALGVSKALVKCTTVGHGRLLASPQVTPNLVFVRELSTTTSVMTLSLDKCDQLFTYTFDDGTKGTILFEELDKGTYDLKHTNVPGSAQGKGYGRILALAVFQYCLDNNIKVVLTCEYLQSVICKNSKFDKILAE